MGKGIAIAVVATLLFVFIQQGSSSEAQIQTADSKAEYQEDFIAEEIAMSAYSILERRAEMVEGPADSVIAHINGRIGNAPDLNGSDTGSFQGGTYEIKAVRTHIDSDVVALQAKGMYGGAEHIIEKFFTAAPSLPPTDWKYNCNVSQGPNFVEIKGMGMGDAGTLLNNGGTINLADTSQIIFLKAQVGGRVNRINEISFSTFAGQDTTLDAPSASGGNSMGYFETPLIPTSAVTVNADVDSNNGARGFVTYAHRRLPSPYFSNGRYLDVQFYHSIHTETFEIPPSSSPRSVHVDFVMYDKDDDGRTVTMSVEADAAIESRTIGMPNMDRELSIETVSLHNVPGHVTTVYVSIDTNDSLYWKMAHLYTSGCN